ncbi:MAG: ribosome assembly RNA-binding protein YhbY [Oscillospiraceae bacterium]|nr:ribosome assembly RNA-binding protein YhbY [Oscillospiraceae bacterium]MDY4588622.1 ribosome assembly RNA-binding protein YhbY [Oscillospiraceae bacterium]
MLTSKQRAQLRSIAQSYNTIFFVGKQGIGEELVKQLDDALNARELIKAGVQENCEFTAREAADQIAEQLKADVVQVIGRKFVLWRRSKDPKKRVIELER